MDKKLSNQKNKQFRDMNLSHPILESLEVLNYTIPTEIQESIIPLILEGKDVVAKSKTGSGKTAAFGIPICEMTSWEGRLPQVLILEPTRELAEQVRVELFCIGRKKRLKIPAIFGGFPIDKQIQTLRQKTHIIVGTPGRILDHIRRNTLDLSQVQKVVIDEADLMLDMGFLDEVKEILEGLNSMRQTILCSATVGEQMDSLIRLYMKEPVLVDLVKEEISIKEIRQIFYAGEKEEKIAQLEKILYAHNPSSCVIFAGTKEMVQVLYQRLRRNQIYTIMLHGNQDQKERMKTIEDFSRGKSRYLIATDIASRGIDFTKVSHVINFDFPTGKETYIHRIGRTGRNKEQGIAISLITSDDEKMKASVESYMGISIQVEPLPIISKGIKEEFFQRQQKKETKKPLKGDGFKKEITKLHIGGGRKSKMRAVDIVGTICNIEGISNEDIGIIDVRDSLTIVEVLHNKGEKVYQVLQKKPIKGKVRKVRKIN